jgi:chromosome partitioning protein
MIVTVASFKGGQAKTTTAVHLAALLNLQQPTLLVDGDPNRSATGWQKRGGFPFRVVDERQAVRYAREFAHIVVDTQARPSEDDFRVLAGGCDQLVVPLTPDALSLETLFLLSDALKRIDQSRFKVLLTIVPPKPAKDGEEVRQTLLEAQFPVFAISVRRYKAYQKAASIGKLVCDVDDPHAADAWEDYVGVTQEIIAPCSLNEPAVKNTK